MSGGGCGQRLLAYERGKDAWLKMSDPSGEVVSFHGHRAVFSSRSPYLARVLCEPQNYYGAAVFFDSFGAARHAFDVVRYMYLGADCLSMEVDALLAYRAVFERLQMDEELQAVRGLLEPPAVEAPAVEPVAAEPVAVKPPVAEPAAANSPSPSTKEGRRKSGPAIVLTVFTRVGHKRRSARLSKKKKPRRSARVRQLPVRS